MNKNYDYPVVDIQLITEDWGIEYFSSGHEIVFVTEQNCLLGCITRGDAKRLILRNSRGNRDFRQIVNRKSKRILYKDDVQVENDAEKLFEQYSRIHNIPVVDDQGRILYVCDREKGEEIPDWKRIYLYQCDAYLEKFYRWTDVACYYVIGEDETVLKEIQKICQEELSAWKADGVVKCIIIRELEKCDLEQCVVICFNDFVQAYLLTEGYVRNTYGYKQIGSFGYIDRLNNIDETTYDNWLELFGYEEVYFKRYNKYTEECTKKMWVNKFLQELPDNAECVEQEIICFSEKRTLQDSYDIDSFIRLLLKIQAYEKVTGHRLSKQEYFEGYRMFLERIKHEKDVQWLYLHKHHNRLDREVYDYINKLRIIDTDLLDETKKYEKKYTLLLNVHDKAEGNKKIFRDMQLNAVMATLEKAIISECKKRYKNIFVHTLCNDNGRKWYHEANLLVAGRREFFSENYLSDLIGDTDFDVERYAKDVCVMAACIKPVGHGYSKYISNSADTTFKTNLYGNRKVVNSGNDTMQTIYMLGNCHYHGYVVKEEDSIASILSRIVYTNAKKAKVNDLSVAVEGLEDRYFKLYDSNIANNDIVIIYATAYWDEDVIMTDMELVGEQIKHEWYWDVPIHCGREGYEIIANQIYERICPVLESQKQETYEFRVLPETEREIEKYLKLAEKIINSDEKYRSLTARSELQEMKAGAIVMNCNPFTYGHQYLIETAARLVHVLYIFVVEEDKSVFPFEQRIRLVREGTKHLDNVIVVPSGKFMISSTTFPGYFMKDNVQEASCDSFLDLKIFAHYVAPRFNIGIRFVGEEPFDKVTAQYNADMKVILNEQNIMVLEIPRKKNGANIISATTVRKLLAEKNWDELERYVPQTTLIELKR